MNGGPLPTDGGYPGQAWFQTSGNQFQALDFMIRQVIAGKAWSGLVLVVAVHGGGIDSPSTADVQPMVNQQDVLGNQQPHGVVYGLPCFRYQAGSAAVIVDPVIGDIGHAIICDRDISGVKASRAISPAGSYRQQSWSDGIYYGSVLGSTITDYVKISSGKIDIVSSGTISITAGGGFGITITDTGTSIDGKQFMDHVHTGVQAGSSDTGGVA